MACCGPLPAARSPATREDLVSPLPPPKSTNAIMMPKIPNRNHHPRKNSHVELGAPTPNPRGGKCHVGAEHETTPRWENWRECYLGWAYRGSVRSRSWRWCLASLGLGCCGRGSEAVKLWIASRVYEIALSRFPTVSFTWPYGKLAMVYSLLYLCAKEMYHTHVTIC